MNEKVTAADQQLRPKETVQKMLISTTSRMVGEYESRGILIAHAWPDLRSGSSGMRFTETHMSRSAYVIAFETPPVERKLGAVLPDYSPVGKALAAYSSVLFGKRFDSHGVLEGSGFYQIPDLSSYDTPSNPELPFNSHAPRLSLPVPLNLTQLARIDAALVGPPPDRVDLSRLNAACKFYMQALQNAESNPEVAYLHLITAGEILAGYYRYADARGVKKKFVRVLCSLLDEGFYRAPDSVPVHARFAPNGIEESVGAAHDLRSRYVHSGAPFGKWVEPELGIRSGDLQIGSPVVEDKALGRILSVAPTFLGLERLVRYCVLRFMASRGVLAPDPVG
ncbi:MAG: hypothetical protein F4Z65_03905 [Acidobacteria bacterium]|nr:hypothetical protein [Acidobacteriota bacterium]MYA46409.1 hypothetical protein [Acidobacteriota bacterium]MYI40125.1 hypothetical protein [Acidobacteriota bacterium]